MSDAYVFGDDDRAAERLALVAEVFEEPSRAFLTAEAPRSPALAVDLGCGPGHSTRLLAEVTGAQRTVGVDSSRPFVERASGAAPPGVEFVVHDVTSTPLPTDPADVAYCRLVLAHLADPASVVRRWVGELAPGGRLLVDELESIDAPHPALARYEELAVRVVRARGGVMYAGPAVDEAGPVVRRRVEHRVPVPVAARMYALNLAAWRDDAALADSSTARIVGGVAASLGALAGSHDSDDVVWHLHQTVFEAPGPRGPGTLRRGRHRRGRALLT